MQVTIDYTGGRTYGTSVPPARYAAKIGCRDEEIGLEIKFPIPVQGMSQNPNILSYVEACSLSLTRSEAMKIGTMLLAAAQQPANWWLEDSRWMPPDLMPNLEKADWEETVTLECLGYGLDYKITNGSRFHVGLVKIECEIAEHDKDKIQFLAVDCLIDLPPLQSRQVTIQHLLTGVLGDQIKSASIIAVTGVDLSVLWNDVI